MSAQPAKPSPQAASPDRPHRAIRPAKLPRGGRELAIKVLLMVFGVVAALALAELTIRLFPRAFGIHASLQYYMPHVFAQDDTITWTLLPGARSRHEHFAGDFNVEVTVDQRGFRKTQQAKGRPNLLILGDSFTFGLGVEDDETYPAQLAARLPDWNILNAGYTGGASLDTQFLWLRQHVQTYQPKLVLFQVFEANDYNEIAANTWEQVDDAGLPLKIRTKYFVRPNEKILSHHYQGLVRRTAALLRRSSHLGFLLVNKCEVLYFLTLPKLLGLHQQLEDTPEIKQFADATFEKIKLLLDGIRAHSAEHGYQYGFVLVPRTYWQPGKKLALYKSQLIENHLREQGVRFTTLDALWDMNPELLHLPNDAHYTTYGNQVVAAEITKWLQAAFEIPSAPGFTTVAAP